MLIIREDNKHYDTTNLRLNAKFETRISKDVYWVPVNSLGGTRYTNTDIEQLVTLQPDEKCKAINTLYEAIQLFQHSNFIEMSDVRIIEENGVEWEHHKPGYEAVRTNRGCCASDSSWLTYILEGCYSEMGLFAISRIWGNGHIINYIKQDGWYYFIDMMTNEKQYVKSVSVETGKIADFRKTKYITGILTKAKSLEAFANFFSRYMLRKVPEHIFFIQREKYCVPIAQQKQGFTLKIIYPNNYNIEVVAQERMSRLMCYELLSAPKIIPDWSTEKDGDFNYNS